MNKKELMRRYVFFLFGLFVSALGVSLATKARLGTSPISSIPYVLSLKFSPSLGTFTLYFSLVLIIIQILLLRRKFPKLYLLQIPISLLFSYFIDLTMSLIAFEPTLYIFKIMLLIAGCLALGVGVFIQMIADVIMLPGEAFVRAVSTTFNKDFGKTKVVFDCSMTVIAALIGFVLFQQLTGVREGTLIAAISVGLIAKELRKRFSFIEKYLIVESIEDDESVILPTESVVE